MYAKRVLIISGREHSGKSGLIINTYQWLLSQKNYLVIKTYPSNGYDVSCLLEDNNGKHVLIHSATDDNDRLDELKKAIDDCKKDSIIIDILISSCRSPLHEELRKSTLEILECSSSKDTIRVKSHDQNVIEIPLIRVLDYEGTASQTWRNYHMLEVIKNLL